MLVNVRVSVRSLHPEHRHAPSQIPWTRHTRYPLRGACAAPCVRRKQKEEVASKTIPTRATRRAGHYLSFSVCKIVFKVEPTGQSLLEQDGGMPMIPG